MCEYNASRGAARVNTSAAKDGPSGELLASPKTEDDLGENASGGDD